ncbi:MAG: PKD domain-containing protein [Bacteroidia bacterium]|nr:PKD domain-containing protein [Bacteroidia bacterium]
MVLNQNLNAGNIETSKDICIGNLAYFKTTGITGINSYKWSFGDGFTSQNSVPFHLYKSVGKFLVKLEVNTSSGILKDSIEIEVHDLPKAKLSEFRFDSCLYSNLFEFKDSSSPSKTNNPIVKRLIVWGDGQFVIDNTIKFGEIVSHHYQMKDKYKIKIEITDNKGCKASSITKVLVTNGTKAKIDSKVTYPSCGEAEVCFSNKSETSNGNSQTYLWQFDGGQFNSQNMNYVKCFSTKTSKNVKAILMMSNPDKTCLTSDTLNIYLNTDSISGDISINDSIFCYGSGSKISMNYPYSSSYKYFWEIDNQDINYHESLLEASPRELKLNPGYHQIKCTITKGPCIAQQEAQIKVIGPIAGMKIFNQKQCEIDKRVYFIETSQNLDRKNALFYWNVIDPEG